MVSLTGQIFGTSQPNYGQDRLKTGQKPVNLMWSLILWSGFWDRPRFWDWLTGQNRDQ